MGNSVILGYPESRVHFIAVLDLGTRLLPRPLIGRSDLHAACREDEDSSWRIAAAVGGWFEMRRGAQTVR